MRYHTIHEYIIRRLRIVQWICFCDKPIHRPILQNQPPTNLPSWGLRSTSLWLTLPVHVSHLVCQSDLCPSKRTKEKGCKCWVNVNPLTRTPEEYLQQFNLTANGRLPYSSSFHSPLFLLAGVFSNSPRWIVQSELIDNVLLAEKQRNTYKLSKLTEWQKGFPIHQLN